MSARRNKMQRLRAGDGGTHWISYSDMMASLLLIFILAVVLSIYNYNRLLDIERQQLGEQQAALEAAQITLAAQEEELETTRVQLVGKEEALTAIQIQLDTKEQNLNAAMVQLSEQEAQNRQLLVAIQLQKENLAEQEDRIAAMQLLLSQQEQELSSYQVQLTDLLGVRTRIVEDLRNALSRASIAATVDPNTGDIVLDSTLMYETNSAVIREEGLRQLDRLIPIYLGVLLSEEYRDYIAEIIVEGHTDSTGRYERNLELSQERALNVAKYCINLSGLTAQQKTLLKKIITAQGRADSNLIYDASGNEDQDRSRRVEIKFRLKDNEMIQRMSEILADLE